MLITLNIIKRIKKINDLTNNFKAVLNKKRNTECRHLKGVKNDPKNEFNEDHVVVAVLLILFIVIINVVSILGFIVYQEWIFFETKLIEDFSVPCSSLSLSPDEDYVTFELNKSGLKTYIDHNGNYICSKKNLTEILQTIVEKVCRTQIALGKEKQYLACGNESLRETSGYQTVYFREILKQQNNSDDKLYWNKHPSKCYMDKSIEYDNGEVTIPEGRGYFLYASVHFNISRKNSNEPKGVQRPQRITLRICKSIFGYEQTLLGRSELFKTTNTGDVVGSLKIETHIHLTRNDKIYVRVNDASQIIHNSKGNTFGLFPL